MNDSKKDKMSMYLIDFAGNFAQNIGYNSQDIIRIDLIDFPQLNQSMIIINISTNPFFDSF